LKRHPLLISLIIISVFLFISVSSAVDTPGTDNGTINALNNSNSAEYKENELFVKFKPEASEDAVRDAHLEIGATILKEYVEIKGLQLVEIPDDMPLNEALTKYKQNKNVIYAEPNYVYKKDSVPNDPYYNDLYGLTKINASGAWDITTGSHAVIIAVVDSGVNISHPDLVNNIWVNPNEIAGDGIDNDGNNLTDDINGWNFLDNSSNVTDDNGHGTHVAGIIAATGNNLLGVTGMMWNVQIMVLKFLDENGYGYIEDAVSAILYASNHGANIISNSWGGGSYTQTLKDAIDASKALVVCAAGNEYSGVSNDVNPTYPASFTSANIISVAATDENDNIAYFSNFGENSVDVAAPGKSIFSTYRGTYGYLSGTSMATPYVSGLAGLIKSLRPDLNALQIKTTILNNVDFITSLTGKVLTSGRINAYKALTNIITNTSIPTASANLKGGNYYSPISVNLTTDDSSKIYYTLNGNTPTIYSSLYTSPLYIPSTKVLKFITVNSVGTISKVYKENYNIYSLVTYSYTTKVWYKSTKKYKVWYKKAYKKWYKYRGVWKYKLKYKWKYKRVYKWLYRNVIRYGTKYVLKY